jgi:putative SOS response-associated peptidase YedK
MCARMVWVSDATKSLWVQRLVFTPEAEWALTGIEEYRMPSTYYKVTPSYHCAVLRPSPSNSGDGPVLRFERAKGGVEGGPGMGNNARAENLHKSGLWRPLVGKNHGLIVADGFYEWDTTAGRKQPYFIHRSDGQPMLMAAL